MQQTEQGSNSLRAFTLVELLVVVLVISTLLSIAIPRMQGMRDEANQVKAKAETRALGAAIESYYIRQSPNSFPDSSTTICASILNKAKPLIISDVLFDPFLLTGHEYNYILSANKSYYVVFSVGMNLVPDIQGIDNDGNLLGVNDDDIYWTNGKGF